MKSYIKVLRIKNIGWLIFTNFLLSLTFFDIVFTLLLQSRGINFTQIFILEAVLSLFVLICEIPSGYLADRWGRKPLFIIAVICFAGSTLMIAISQSFVLFLVHSVLYGIGAAAMSGTDEALIYETLQKKEQTTLSRYAFSLQAGSSTAAMLISFPLGSFIAQYSLNLTAYFSIGSMVLAIVSALFIKETKTKVKLDNQEIDKSSRAESAFLYVIKKQPMLVLINILSSAASAFILSLLYFNQPLFLSFGVNIVYFGVIMLGANGLSTLGSVSAPSLASYLGVGRIIVLSSLITGSLFILLAYITNAIFGLAIFALIMGVGAIRGPLVRTIINDTIDHEARTTVLSYLSFIGSLVGITLNPIIGWQADLGLNRVFIIEGSLLLVVGIGFAVVFTKQVHRNDKKKQDQHLSY